MKIFYLFFSRIISLCVIVTFVTSMVITPKAAYAQSGVMGLPAPGTMVDLSPSYVPLMVTGLTIHPENPLLMDFIVSTGNSGLNAAQVKKQSDRLIKYFLACLTIPENDQWVNLSPYEKQRIVPEDLGQTVLGQDMLAQDYILKQLTASLIYPEKNLGKNFWDKVYAKASEEYGTTEIPVNTFNKVWILPDTAKVFEHNNTVIVVKSHLKVILDEDYLAISHNVIPAKAGIHTLASQVIRQIILPAIEQEVNQGQNFAQLRQIYNSMILAVWFKKNLKQALLNQVYTDKAKINGVNVDDPTIKEKIYDQYLKAYKKGVFNYIKEDPIVSFLNQKSMSSPNAFVGDPEHALIPRKYFSGGVTPFTARMLKLATVSEVWAYMKQVPGAIFFRLKGLTQRASIFNQSLQPDVAMNGDDYRHLDIDDLEISLRRNVLPSAEDAIFATYTDRGAHILYSEESPGSDAGEDGDRISKIIRKLRSVFPDGVGSRRFDYAFDRVDMGDQILLNIHISESETVDEQNVTQENFGSVLKPAMQRMIGSGNLQWVEIFYNGKPFRKIEDFSTQQSQDYLFDTITEFLGTRVDLHSRVYPHFIELYFRDTAMVTEEHLTKATLDLRDYIPEEYRGMRVRYVLVADNSGTLTMLYSEPLPAEIVAALKDFLSHLQNQFILNTGDRIEAVEKGHQEVNIHFAENGNYNRVYATWEGGTVIGRLNDKGVYEIDHQEENWKVGARYEVMQIIAKSFYEKVRAKLAGLSESDPVRLQLNKEKLDADERKVLGSIRDAYQEGRRPETPEGKKEEIVTRFLENIFSSSGQIVDSGAKFGFDLNKLSDEIPSFFNLDFFQGLQEEIKGKVKEDVPLSESLGFYYTYAGSKFFDFQKTNKAEAVDQIVNSKIKYDPKMVTVFLVIGDNANDLDTMKKKFGTGHPNEVTISIFLNHNKGFRGKLPRGTFISKKQFVLGALEGIQWAIENNGKTVEETSSLELLEDRESNKNLESLADEHEASGGDVAVTATEKEKIINDIFSVRVLLSHLDGQGHTEENEVDWVDLYGLLPEVFGYSGTLLVKYIKKNGINPYVWKRIRDLENTQKYPTDNPWTKDEDFKEKMKSMINSIEKHPMKAELLAGEDSRSYFERVIERLGIEGIKDIHIVDSPKEIYSKSRIMTASGEWKSLSEIEDLAFVEGKGKLIIIDRGARPWIIYVSTDAAMYSSRHLTGKGVMQMLVGVALLAVVFKVASKIIPDANPGLTPPAQKQSIKPPKTVLAEPGGIDLNSRNLSLESEGQKVKITFDPAMIAQFKRGDFSGVKFQIFEVAPVSLISLLGMKELTFI